MINKFTDTTADTLATASIISTIASFSTEVQPIVSLMAGMIAIASGCFAVRYYYVKGKNDGKD
jgi:hypothetical protein